MEKFSKLLASLTITSFLAAVPAQAGYDALGNFSQGIEDAPAAAPSAPSARWVDPPAKNVTPPSMAASDGGAGTNPAANAPANCDGLKSPVGKDKNFGLNHKDRMKNFEKLCGKNGTDGALGKELAALKKKLAASCDNVVTGKGSRGGGQGMVTSLSMGWAEGRLKDACKTYQQYIADSKVLCENYEQSASLAKAAGKSNINEMGQQANMNQAAKMNATAGKNLGAFKSYAGKMNKKVKELDGLGKEADDKMAKIIYDMMADVKKKIVRLDEQARAKLAKRQSAIKDEGGEALRFSTQKDVQSFYVKLDACKRASSGDARSFLNRYQQHVGKPLVGTVAESSALASDFGQREGLHNQMAARIDAAGKNLGDSSISGASRAPASNAGPMMGMVPVTRPDGTKTMQIEPVGPKLINIKDLK